MSSDRDIVQRMQAIRDIEVDESSTARAVARARRAVLDAEAGFGRTMARRRAVRIAASLSWVVVASLVFAFLVRYSSDSSVAFAQVRKRVQETRSIRFVQTTIVNGNPTQTIRGIILATGLMRTDNADGSYSILDTRNRRSMSVSADRTRAAIWHEMPAQVPANLYDYIKHMHEGSTKKLPARIIDGAEAPGFSVEFRYDLMGKTIDSRADIWVDAETGLPVRMEVGHGEEFAVVIHDIRFDEEVDLALLQFQPPPGATVDQFGSAQPPPADVQNAVDRIRAGQPSESHAGGPVRLGDVLDRWDAGEKDAAARQLVAIEWDEAGVLTGIAAMDLSEQEFVRLPHADRVLVQERAIGLVVAIKQLANHALSVGGRAEASGDRKTAAEYYRAVRGLGAALSSPEVLLVFQQLGRAVVSRADEKLGSLP